MVLILVGKSSDVVTPQPFYRSQLIPPPSAQAFAVSTLADTALQVNKVSPQELVACPE